MKQKILRLPLFLMLLAGACSVRDPLIGQWERVNAREQVIGGPSSVIAFGGDGDYVANFLIGGKWRRLDAGRIEITTEFPGSKEPIVEIKTVTDNGEVLTLDRSKRWGYKMAKVCKIAIRIDS